MSTFTSIRHISAVCVHVAGQFPCGSEKSVAAGRSVSLFSPTAGDRHMLVWGLGKTPQTAINRYCETVRPARHNQIERMTLINSTAPLLPSREVPEEAR